MGPNDSSDLFEDSELYENETNAEIFIKLFSDNIEDESTLSLLTGEELPQIILNSNNYFDCIHNNNNNKYIQYISGLINVMKRLSQSDDQILDLWTKSLKQTQNCILSTIFKELPNCYPTLCLPKIIDMSDSDLQISFYEYVCYNICGFVLTLNQYEFVEQLLFENLLSNQCVCNLLASDVLCFTARQSVGPLCYHYCCLLFNLSVQMNDCNDYCFTNLVSVLSRLLPLLQDIEIQYIIEDYGLINYSQVWMHLNLSHILSSQQICDTFIRINSGIETDVITNQNIHILKNILMSDELNAQIHQRLSPLFTEVFCKSNTTQDYCDLIELLIVLLPNTSNEVISKLMVKIRDILIKTNVNIGLALVVSQFLNHLSIVQMRDSLENTFTKQMTSIIMKIFEKTQHFYIKFSLLDAMTNISLKSKYISIIMKCCQNENIKKAFEYHLKSFKGNVSMDENEKIDYLHKRIENKLKRIELKHMNTIAIEESDGFSFGDNLQIKKRKISEECDTNTKILTNIDVNDSQIKGTLDVMETCIQTLKLNRGFISSQNEKQRMVTVFYEFSDIIDRIKE